MTTRSPRDLYAAEERRGVRLQLADALVVRAGWTLTADPPVPGISVDAVRWMHRRGVSLYTGDIGDAPPHHPGASARGPGDRWRAVWYENGCRRQCEAVTEGRLAARLDKVTEPLAAEAPNLERSGADPCPVQVGRPLSLLAPQDCG